MVVHTDSAVCRVPQAAFAVSAFPYFSDDALNLSSGSAAPVLV